MNTKPRRFVRLPEVMERTGLSRTALERLEAEGLFPKHVKISSIAKGWIEAEFETWFDSRIAASRPGTEKANHV